MKRKEAAKRLAAAQDTEEEAEDAEKDEKDKKDMVTKTAMDSALKLTRDAAVKETIAQQNAIRDAEKFVRPWVGELAMAHDSAVGVYKSALKALAVDGVEKVEDTDALKAIIKAQPVPGAKRVSETPLGMDAATVDSYAKMFPLASRIGHAG